jgi:UDP-perosamine 4-acetyltransferase
MRLPRNVVVFGAGGHAKVVIEILRAQGDQVVGAIAPSGEAIMGVPVIGRDEDAPELLARGLSHAFVAIGANRARFDIGRRLERLGFTLVNAIHPQAILSPSVRIGCGVAIMAGVVVNADSGLGDHCVVNTRAGLDHDCEHIAPGVTCAGGVRVGERAFLGAGATAIPGIEICADAIVGAGAVVVRSIATPGTYVGLPARAHPQTKEARE